jgi:transcriptional regulator with XRE-family HTH domain
VKKETEQNLGAALTAWRKKYALSQDQVAGIIGVARTAVVQIEGGGRQMGLYEARALAHYYGISLDALFFPPSEMDDCTGLLHEPTATYAPVLPSERTVSAWNPATFAEAILFLLESIGPATGLTESTVLLLAYLSDFEHYARYETGITGAKYLKTGPSTLTLSQRKVLDELYASGRVQRLADGQNKGGSARLLAWDQANPRLLSGTAFWVLSNTTRRFGHFSPEELSALVETDVPLKGAAIGSELNYELAFYRLPPFYSPIHEE